MAGTNEFWPPKQTDPVDATDPIFRSMFGPSPSELLRRIEALEREVRLLKFPLD